MTIAYCRFFEYRACADNVPDPLTSENIRQVVGIPMGTNYAPLVAELFLFCLYEREFMMSLSDDKQADFVDVSKYYSPRYGQ